MHAGVSRILNTIIATPFLVDNGLKTWNERGWGCLLKQTKNLKEFGLQLEYAEGDEDKLNETVTRAKTWEFPFYNPDHMFNSEGLAVQSWTWKRPLKLSGCEFCGIQPCGNESITEKRWPELEDCPNPTRIVKVIKRLIVPVVEA